MGKFEEQGKHRAWRQAHYSREDINGRLVINLRDISHTMRGLYEGRGSQKRVLIFLQELGPITQRDLTERLGIQPGSASEVIAKLESAGLVTRTASEEDRRTVNVALTEEGRRQAEEAKNQRIQRHQEMFSVLTDEEKEGLLALLERIHEDWESRYPDRREDHGHDHGHHHHHCEARMEDGGFHSGHEDRQGCNHDCENCPHPCGRSQKR